MSNRTPVPITGSLSSRTPAIVLPNPGPTIPAGPVSTSHNSLGYTPTGGANNKYNFPGEIGNFFDSFCTLYVQVTQVIW